MATIPCFLLEDYPRIRRFLRRYGRNDVACPHGYHDAQVVLDEIERPSEDNLNIGDDWPHDDPRWPVQCEHCGYVFTLQDNYQLNQDHLLRRVDTGEVLTLHAANQLPGAMYRAPWYPCTSQDDEPPLVVVTPGGPWCVDSQSSNCGLLDDPHQDKHHCWVRHGSPPNITVDKDGPTCSAGSGSILCASYHGFLRNGFLVD